MSPNREKVELTIGWDTSFYSEKIIDAVYTLPIEVMMDTLNEIYLATQAILARRIPTKS